MKHLPLGGLSALLYDFDCDNGISLAHHGYCATALPTFLKLRGGEIGNRTALCKGSKRCCFSGDRPWQLVSDWHHRQLGRIALPWLPDAAYLTSVQHTSSSPVHSNWTAPFSVHIFARLPAAARDRMNLPAISLSDAAALARPPQR